MWRETTDIKKNNSGTSKGTHLLLLFVIFLTWGAAMYTNLPTYYSNEYNSQSTSYSTVNTADQNSTYENYEDGYRDGYTAGYYGNTYNSGSGDYKEGYDIGYLLGQRDNSEGLTPEWEVINSSYAEWKG